MEERDKLKKRKHQKIETTGKTTKFCSMTSLLVLDGQYSNIINILFPKIGMNKENVENEQ